MKEEMTRIGAGRFSSLWANLPGYDLFERLIDVFASRQRIRIIVTSEGYSELRILWGAIEFTKGSKKEFLIEGGPGFCEATLRSLEESKRTVRVVEKSFA